ncbi:inner membrane protein YhjD [Rhodococcus sp. BP-349]|uniref:inner membrane protein YhjD n=1 Tax=unclassified Rhodococcus (in: high G+C Gram-positive bacteria) TaxID=192944 RepID=UPI001C9A5085|nr:MULTISPECIES: inner membrane protein YhjD [unclassified Rhodococcus (in: high G+C Gram-positive bacteria)]MBY6538798.1 inner membrane protein YhjD [Rhodococcus sp. BP-363]MBY6543135.1 inner membrane protein YhjD [Rhodococcus sp. BP-369]MBY6562365.1 inner membrane protein YhjD [Rhodococcus sp. BP-370]MBY6576657.1 inner membrane protein YhjD [Rhodococcus sp. BP-364]MBY6585958.1 inner membrane protein YhjD [Rhodococcus sp. BP-358]
MPDFAAIIEERRRRWPWFDHLARAGSVYQQQKGDYYAAGITYFSVLALFPLLMVAFAVVGFVLASRPDLLTELQSQIAENVPGSFAGTINELVSSAIESRTSVGIIGLLGALYAGLGWTANLREALTAMWETPHEAGSFLATKAKDLGALLGLGLALVISLGLSAVASGSVVPALLKAVNLDGVPGVGVAVQIASFALAIAATWALFVWVIARLPREPVTVRSAARAALLAAVVFEIFKQVGAVYLESVTSGPAGATFGPIIGILVFAFTTSRFLLFSTAWAATATENLALAAPAVPDSAVIAPQVVVREGVSPAGAAALVGAGVLTVLGLGGWRGRRRR